jgi:hypothetical protein
MLNVNPGTSEMFFRYALHGYSVRATPLSGIRIKESRRGINIEIGAATPFAERGRHVNGTKKGVAQKKRHCQSGKYAFEKAKLSKFFSPLNLDETLPRINIA